MKKIFGIFLIVLSLVLGIVPLFTDCLSQGRSLTTTTGMTVPMKCHWSAIAEMVLAVPLGLIGLLTITSKKNETHRALGVSGGALSVLAILIPTSLIGVCANPAMMCNMVMRPTIILTGSIALAASLAVFFTSMKMDNQDTILKVGLAS
jgi:hypothetical protein